MLERMLVSSANDLLLSPVSGPAKDPESLNEPPLTIDKDHYY